MAKLKDSQLILSVEDINLGNEHINRRRYDEDEESPLLHENLGREGEFDCFLDPISLEWLPWYRRPSVCCIK